MNADYVAWNGERYVWPPPEGWYLASDGRWWAPDTGPDMGLDALSDTSVSAESFGEPDPVDDRHTPTDEAFTPPIEAFPPPLSGSSTGIVDPEPRPVTEPGTDRLLTTPLPGSLGAVNDSAATTLVAGDLNNAVDVAQTIPTDMAEAEDGLIDLEPPLDPDAGDQPEGEREDHIQRSRTMPMVAAGLLVAAALCIAALLALLGGDNDEPSQQPSASADAEPSTDDGELVVDTDPSAMEDGSMDDGAMDDGVMDETMSEEDGSTPTSGEDTATTAGAEGESGDAVLIGQFRTLLEESQITAAELTGEDIMVFGETACSYATAATDLEGYLQIRNEALAGAENAELTPEELQLVVDTAVTVFCSEEAARLGLPLSPAEDA